MKNPSKKIGCKIGADKEKIDFILFGDSHVIPLINLVDYLANQEDLSVVYISAGGCLPFLETYLLREDRAITDCANINKNVYQFSNDNNIKGIILAARWSFYTHGDYNLRGGYFVSNDADGPFNFDETINNGFEKGFNKTIDMYNASGIPVHILTQPPHQKYSPMSVYFLASKGLGSINTLSVTKAEFMELNKIPMSVFETRGDDINLYDVTNIYCTKILCPIGTSEKSFYNDENHLSDEGALRLKNVLYSVFLSDP